jgi:hypothetical protein
MSLLKPEILFRQNSLAIRLTFPDGVAILTSGRLALTH